MKTQDEKDTATQKERAHTHNFMSALHKISADTFHYKGERRRFNGYLTPQEFLALVKEGIQLDNHDTGEFEYALKKSKEGHCSPSWHYFGLSKELELFYVKMYGEDFNKHGREVA